MRLDARHRRRHRETEIRIGAEVGVLERAVERGGEQRARRLDRHAMADAVFAAGPAGVDEPAIDVVLGDVFLQQVGINRRMARQERRAEAGRELRHNADETLLGARDLGGVAGEEVIHRLRRRQLRDRRHHAEGVGGEQDDVLRMPGAAAARRVRDRSRADRPSACSRSSTHPCNRERACPDRTRRSRAWRRSCWSRRRSPARSRATG